MKYIYVNDRILKFSVTDSSIFIIFHSTLIIIDLMDSTAVLHSSHRGSSSRWVDLSSLLSSLFTDYIFAVSCKWRFLIIQPYTVLSTFFLKDQSFVSTHPCWISRNIVLFIIYSLDYSQISFNINNNYNNYLFHQFQLIMLSKAVGLLLFIFFTTIGIKFNSLTVFLYFVLVFVYWGENLQPHSCQSQ